MKFSTCNFLLAGADVLAHSVCKAIELKKPFSFVRLGDGEGVLLSVEKDSPAVDFDYLKGHLGSNTSQLQTLLFVKEKMKESILKADFVGVRDDIVNVEFPDDPFELSPMLFLEEFKRSFKLRNCEKDLAYLDARRIYLLYESIRKYNFGVGKQFCSSWVHFELHLSGAIFNILKQQNRIGLISSRAELKPRLEKLFGLDVSFWQIPDMYRDIGINLDANEYLSQLDVLLDEEFVKFSGMLFLVGGGFYGKLYCDLIKSQGGIALDLGSLLDSWVNIHSRPRVFESLSDTNYDGVSVPKELLLTSENVYNLVNSYEKN